MDFDEGVGWVLVKLRKLLDESEEAGISLGAFCMAINHVFASILLMIREEHGESKVREIIEDTLKYTDNLKEFVETHVKGGSKWARKFMDYLKKSMRSWSF